MSSVGGRIGVWRGIAAQALAVDSGKGFGGLPLLRSWTASADGEIRALRAGVPRKTSWMGLTGAWIGDMMKLVASMDIAV